MSLGYEKINLLHLPTPLEFLPAVSADLGINLYIKRDDLTPLCMGGNKLRKLEYFIKDALNKDSTMLLTVGGPQTNHGRLTCAVARKYGLKGAIVAVGSYPGELSSNLLLDGMMGCDVYLKEPEPGVDDESLRVSTAKEVIAQKEAEGERVYFIPTGGSNELGILGYYDCAFELNEQVRELGIDGCRVISTVGSMGTYMGLLTAIVNHNLPMRLTGIGINPFDEGIDNAVVEYYQRVKNFYGLKADVTTDDVDVTSEYDRGAYNNPCREVRDAIYYMAEKEAIILDPCYTGKCFAGLMEMVRSGRIAQGENVVFLHTGGVPGINTPSHRVEIEKERDHFIHVL